MIKWEGGGGGWYPDVRTISRDCQRWYLQVYKTSEKACCNLCEVKLQNACTTVLQTCVESGGREERDRPRRDFREDQWWTPANDSNVCQGASPEYPLGGLYATSSVRFWACGGATSLPLSAVCSEKKNVKNCVKSRCQNIAQYVYNRE